MKKEKVVIVQDKTSLAEHSTEVTKSIESEMEEIIKPKKTKTISVQPKEEITIPIVPLTLDQSIIEFLSKGKIGQWLSLNSFIKTFKDHEERSFAKTLKRTLNALVTDGKIESRGQNGLDAPYWDHQGAASPTQYRKASEVNIEAKLGDNAIS